MAAAVSAAIAASLFGEGGKREQSPAAMTSPTEILRRAIC